MRYGGRETSVIESRGHRSYYKQCNRIFPVWGIFSWRAKNLLESRSLRSGRFPHSSKGLWETFIFLLFTRIINVIEGNVGASISTIIIVAPLAAVMKPAIWNNNNNSHRLGTGRRHGLRHGNVRQCERKVCVWDHFWKPRKAKKKSYLKSYLAAIKRCFNKGQRKSVLNCIWNQILSETNRRK